MNMSLKPGPLLKRLFSAQAFTSVSHYFYMEVQSLLPDLLVGIIIAGALGTLVPEHIWHHFFLTDHPELALFWGPLVGPVISTASFVCSIGNVPLAFVLWNSGISFGGVISFIFADLLIPPILNIYRKYYGGKVAVYLTAVSYAAIVLAGIAVELLFKQLGIVPAHQPGIALQLQEFRLNYTTVLNFCALGIMLVLAWRFLRTGGPEMLKQMEVPSSSSDSDSSCCHSHRA